MYQVDMKDKPNKPSRPSVSSLSISGESPGMTYRAVNDGEWSIEYLSSECVDIIGLTHEQLIALDKNRLSDILIHSSNYLNAEFDLIEDDGTVFQLEYILVTQNGEELRVIESGTRIFDKMGQLVAIEGVLKPVDMN